MHKHLTAILAAAMLVAGSGLAFGDRSNHSTRSNRSFPSQYDTSRRVTVDGVVTTIDWRYPVAFLTIEGRGANGRLAEYHVELGSLPALEQKGWKRDTIKEGETVTIHGWYARADRNRIKALTLEFRDALGVGLTFTAATAAK